MGLAVFRRIVFIRIGLLALPEASTAARNATQG